MYMGPHQSGLLTCPPGSVPSLRASPHNLILTQHFGTGLLAVPSLTGLALLHPSRAVCPESEHAASTCPSGSETYRFYELSSLKCFCNRQANGCAAATRRGPWACGSSAESSRPTLHEWMFSSHL
jgi:hypothetical protein